MSQTVKRSVLLAIVAVVVALVSYFLLRPLPAAKGRGILPGQPAPNFTLVNPAGDRLSLADFQGKAVVLNFWASWCVPCRTEMPVLEEYSKKFAGQGMIVIGVNIRESSVAVQAFQNRYGLTFPLVLDMEGAVTDTYGILPLPTTYFIDRTGLVRRKFEGQVTPALLEEYIREVL